MRVLFNFLSSIQNNIVCSKRRQTEFSSFSSLAFIWNAFVFASSDWMRNGGNVFIVRMLRRGDKECISIWMCLEGEMTVDCFFFFAFFARSSLPLTLVRGEFLLDFGFEKHRLHQLREQLDGVFPSVSTRHDVTSATHTVDAVIISHPVNVAIMEIHSGINCPHQKPYRKSVLLTTTFSAKSFWNVIGIIEI